MVLAPSSSDQITLLNTTAADKKLAELPLYKDLLSSFLTKEVCYAPVQYGAGNDTCSAPLLEPRGASSRCQPCAHHPTILA